MPLPWAASSRWASRASPRPDDTGGSDKCYGVAKAGKNDCASNGHSCAGQAKKDNDPNEWKHMPGAECEKMGGKTTPPAK